MDQQQKTKQKLLQENKEENKITDETKKIIGFYVW